MRLEIDLDLVKLVSDLGTSKRLQNRTLRLRLLLQKFVCAIDDVLK